MAATKARVALMYRAALSADMKAGAKAFANHALLVIISREAEPIEEIKGCGRAFSMVCIGLYPRNAEKIAVVGGTCLKTEAPS